MKNEKLIGIDNILNKLKTSDSKMFSALTLRMLTVNPNDIERYDDRITLSTNLLDCFEIATRFIDNNLPSPFYLEGTQRISLRNNIFREIISNMLVHKEYTGAEPTKLIITRNEIIAENSNKPHIRGIITPQNTINYSKNPNIIKIFRGIGYVEDFGTGIPKLFKYCKAYTNYDPIIEDNNIFRFTLKHNFFNDNTKYSSELTSNSDKAEGKVIKLSDKVIKSSDKVIKLSDKVTKSNSKTKVSRTQNQQKVLEYCKIERTATEILNYLGLKSKTNLFTRTLNPLLEQGLLARTASKPNSSNQRYKTIKID